MDKLFIVLELPPLTCGWSCWKWRCCCSWNACSSGNPRGSPLPCLWCWSAAGGSIPPLRPCSACWPRETSVAAGTGSSVCRCLIGYLEFLQTGTDCDEDFRTWNATPYQLLELNFVCMLQIFFFFSCKHIAVSQPDGKQKFCTLCHGLLNHLLQYLFTYVCMSRGDYCLTGRPRFDSRQGQGFFLLVSASRPAQGAHPVFCPVGTWCPFPRGKRSPDVTLTTHPI